MKKVIRLTESDLHRIVEGSVKKILSESEIDWRTFANAAKKAKSNGDWKRGMMFGHRADTEFRKKHGLKSTRINPTSDFTSDEPFVTLDDYEDGYIAYGNKEKPFTKSAGSFYKTHNVPIDDTDRSRLSHIQGDALGAQKELEDYASGKSKYVPGKGWQ